MARFWHSALQFFLLFLFFYGWVFGGGLCETTRHRDQPVTNQPSKKLQKLEVPPLTGTNIQKTSKNSKFQL